MRELLIFAGSEDQARSAARWLGLDPRAWKYLASIRDLEGTDSPRVLKFGTYYLRKDSFEIADACAGHRAFISELVDR